MAGSAGEKDGLRSGQSGVNGLCGPVLILANTTMTSTFDFELASVDDKTRLARVLNHFQRIAHGYHGTGACSAFQISVELARCLVVSFTLSFRGSSPTVQAATDLVIYCHALVTAYHEDGLVSKDATGQPPDPPCWSLFFYMASKHGPDHPNPAVACEIPTTMLANLAYMKPQMDAAGGDGAAFESLCHGFANIQLDALRARVGQEPALLACSILESSQTIVYKPGHDAANCVLHVAGFLAHNLRERSVVISSSNLSMALSKVLASCAFWNALAVGRAFCTAFIQRFLISFAQVPTLATFMGEHTAVDFVNLVHFCALQWQPTAGDAPQGPALELQDKNEHAAIEHVLNSLLRGYADAPGAPLKALETVAIRELPDLADACLTPLEYHRVLVRQEMLHGGHSTIHMTTWAGAPPVNLHPPACPMTPAEIICYFPRAMSIPCIWKWISGHGWMPVCAPLEKR